MRDPCAIVAVIRFALFVGANFGKCFLIRLRIVLYRDLSRHSAHGENIPPVTGLDAEERIGMHEVRRHRHQRAIGQQEIALAPKLLDAGENVIPSTAIQVLPNDRAIRKGSRPSRTRPESSRSIPSRGSFPAEVQGLLGHLEDVVPKARFEMAFHLGQIKIRAAATRDEFLRVVEEKETEIEKPA